MKYLADLILILLHLAEQRSTDGWFHGITRLEKIIFLLIKERSIDEWIEMDKPTFVPYKLGPYSRDVYTSIEFLNSYNLIEDATVMGDSHLDSTEEAMAFEAGSIHYSERKFRLTENGRRAANELRRRSNNHVTESAEEYYTKYSEMQLSLLLRYVYRQYPAYTGESIIKKDILGTTS